MTRGTTGTNRLRRMDRWIAALPVLRRTDDPLVVDLGYGRAPWTVLELHDRLARVRQQVEVVGVEIDPERVAAAKALTAGRGSRGRRDAASQPSKAGDAPVAVAPGRSMEGILAEGTSTPVASASAGLGPVSFVLGGFESPTPDGRRPAVIRAANVLRQYDESEVAGAWATMLGRLQPGGALVEGTCSEDGRIGAWVTLSPERGPESLTLGVRLASIGSSAFESPSVVAERLPKALIHRNVPGEPVHAFLTELDRAWAAAAPLSAYGPVQRWIATAEAVREHWPILGGRARWRLGELTVAWAAVAPAA